MQFSGRQAWTPLTKVSGSAHVMHLHINKTSDYDDMMQGDKKSSSMQSSQKCRITRIGTHVFFPGTHDFR